MKKFINLISNLNPKFIDYIALSYCIAFYFIIYKRAITSSIPNILLLSIPVIVFLGYKINEINSTSKIDDITKVELSLLLLVIIQLVLEISDRKLSPIFFLFLPFVYAYLGIFPAVLVLTIISIIETKITGTQYIFYNLLPLCLSTVLFGKILKNRHNPLNEFISKKSKNNIVVENQTDLNNISESPTVSLIDSELNKLNNLISNNSIVLYINGKNGLYELKNFISRDPENIDEGQSLIFRSGYINWALKTKTPVSVGNIKSIKDNIFHYKNPPEINSIMAIPIMFNDDDSESNPDGILILDSLNKNAFDENDKFFATIFCEKIISIYQYSKLSLVLNQYSIELNSIYKYVQDLESNMDVELILKHLFESLNTSIKPDILAIIQHKPEIAANELILSNINYENVVGKIFDNRNSLTGVSSEKNKVLEFTDISNRSKHRSVFNRELDFSMGIKNIKYVLIIPISVKISDQPVEEKPFGSVLIGKDTDDRLSDDQKRLAKILTQQAAKAIQNSLNLNKIKELALIDSLSGLYNHRHFQELLSNIISRSVRYPEEVSCVIIDIDNFKQINDNMGHQTCDRIIQRVGKIIKDNLRESDISARYGGDEFAIALPKTNEDGAKIVTNKLKDRISYINFDYNGKTCSITLSIGISTFPQNATTKDNLIKKADEALYEAKNLGKDRIIHFNDLKNSVSPELKKNLSNK